MQSLFVQVGLIWLNLNANSNGTLLAQFLHISASDDVSLEFSDGNKLKYIDVFTILELIAQAEVTYWLHMTSIIMCLPMWLLVQNFFQKMTNTQEYVTSITQQTTTNKMLLNGDLLKYIVFTKTHENFSTRFTLKEILIERVNEAKWLGVWFNKKLDWSTKKRTIVEKHTVESAY